MHLHQIILLGRAVKDAEEFTTKTGKNFAKFTLAINEYLGKEKDEKTYFYDVLVFGKTAPKAFEYIKKADTVMVQGRPEAGAYISKKDDKAKGVISIMADSWNVLK
jgi:single stranded DNA-binding protein